MNVSALLLTVPEVAALTQLSEAQLYLMVRRTEILHLKVGRVVRIARADLERWITQQAAAADGRRSGRAA